MAVTVTANDRTVVHRGSDGTGYAFPDVCRTPPADLPVAYPNAIYSIDAEGTCASVFCDGYAVMNAKSFFARSYLDEPGTGGGIFSGVNMGKGSFSTSSPDVFFEGAPAPRHLDKTKHNHGSPWNAVSVLLQISELLSIEAKLCLILCFCNEPGFKTWCLDAFLATPTPVLNRAGDWGMGWDPRFHNVWVEVPYTPSGTYVPSWTPSAYQKDKNRKPLPIPGSWENSNKRRNSSRPDVVVTWNRYDSPTPGNIAQIFEIKFDGDPRGSGTGLQNQVRKYQNIGPTTVLTAKSCGCNARRPPPKRRRVRVRVPDPKPVRVPVRVPVVVPVHFEVPTESGIGWATVAIGAGIGAGILLVTGGGGAVAAAASRTPLPVWLARILAF
ncbi:MAG: DUF4150 domain-containing protein [Polyangiaceae bacterium]